MQNTKQELAKMLAEDRKYGEKTKHGQPKANKGSVYKKHGMGFKNMSPKDIMQMDEDWED